MMAPQVDRRTMLRCCSALAPGPCLVPCSLEDLEEAEEVRLLNKFGVMGEDKNTRMRIESLLLTRTCRLYYDRTY